MPALDQNGGILSRSMKLGFLEGRIVVFIYVGSGFFGGWNLTMSLVFACGCFACFAFVIFVGPLLGEFLNNSSWKSIVTLTRFLHRKEHPCTADLLMCALL